MAETARLMYNIAPIIQDNTQHQYHDPPANVSVVRRTIYGDVKPQLNQQLEDAQRLYAEREARISNRRSGRR